jgi:hypothetical protein
MRRMHIDTCPLGAHAPQVEPIVQPASAGASGGGAGAAAGGGGGAATGGGGGGRVVVVETATGSRTVTVHSSQQFVCIVSAFCTQRNPGAQSASQRHDLTTHVSGGTQMASRPPIRRRQIAASPRGQHGPHAAPTAEQSWPGTSAADVTRVVVVVGGLVAVVLVLVVEGK